ncbi:uncharacterized protein LOC126811340 [Patella vulgata]|uniref:uncharacterized protein LOC126811340 n=1 Tax=Patella vulgata TaxID=6465 RepID=UPI0024A7C07B|nr:uncharacterized protein LOC126811340 [Patella vulgata]
MDSPKDQQNENELSIVGMHSAEEETDDLWGISNKNNDEDYFEIEENISSDEEDANLTNPSMDSMKTKDVFTSADEQVIQPDLGDDDDDDITILNDERKDDSAAKDGDKGLNSSYIVIPPITSSSPVSIEAKPFSVRPITAPTTQPAPTQIVFRLQNPQNTIQRSVGTFLSNSNMSVISPQSKVFLKPVGSKDPGQVILHSSNSSTSGPVMMSQPNAVKTIRMVVPNSNNQVRNIQPNNQAKSQVVYLNTQTAGNLILQTPPVLKGPVLVNSNQTTTGQASNPAPIFIPSTMLSKNITNSTVLQASKQSAPLKIPTSATQNTAQSQMQPKPGQIVLQTSDGQRLLLQPINSNNTTVPTGKTGTSNLVFQQGKINTLSHDGVKTFIPLQGINKNLKPSTNQALKSLVTPKSNQIIIPLNSALKQENDPNKKPMEKQIDLDTAAVLQRKSVLLNMLTKPVIPEKAIDDDIEILEINKEKTGFGAKNTVEWIEKRSNASQAPNRQVFKKPEKEVFFSKSSSNKKNEDVACYLPLQACGSATLEHLISLTERKKEPPPPQVEEILDERPCSPIVAVQEMPKQPCASNLLKTALKDFPAKQTSGGSRRKQVLTNRTAEAEQSFIKTGNIVVNKPKKKKRPPAKPRVVVETNTSEIDSDEVISSINDFDLEGVYFSSNGPSNMIAIPDKATENNISIKTEPTSPTLPLAQDQRYQLQISDICSLNIDADEDSVSKQAQTNNLSVKRERGHLEDTHLVSIKRIKTESDDTDDMEDRPSGYADIKPDPLKVGQILSSEDLVRRSYRIFSKPTYQSGNIQTAQLSSSQKGFIPITNILSGVKTESIEHDETAKTSEHSVGINSIDPLSPFDYDHYPGPVSVKIGKNIERAKAQMGIKDCFVKMFSDFHIIESRFAINGMRNVYSCNYCKGEYATVNMKSLSEHLEMHRKFPKIHLLVQEKPYEVTALSGNEISEMVAGTEAVAGQDVDNNIQSSSSKKSAIRNKRHFCTLCPYSARNLQSLQGHMNVHIMDSRRTCDICHIVFRNYKVLEMHKTNEHKSEMNKLVYISARPL